MEIVDDRHAAVGQTIDHDVRCLDVLVGNCSEMGGRRGTLFILCGPSAVGKTTVAKAVLEHAPDLRVATTLTTRKSRGAGHEDKVMEHVGDEAFQQAIDDGEFLEWAHVHGHRYGTVAKSVLVPLENGEDVFLNIDVQGARQIREKLPEAVTIFLKPESREALLERLDRRPDVTDKERRIRIDNIDREMAEGEHFHYSVVNETGKLKKTVNEVIHIIEDHR